MPNVAKFPNQDPPKLNVDLSEYGRSGIKRFGGRIYEEFLPNLRGIQGVRVFREMADNDEIVGASLYAIERVIMQASWTVDPYDSSRESMQDADFLEECKSDMEHSWSDLIIEATSNLTYGWSLLETVYKLRKGDNRDKRLNSKYTDGRVSWRKFARRMQSTFDDWEYDETSGDLKGMWQNPPPDYERRFIPLDKAVLFRTKSEGNNPEAKSILRNAYKSYYFKKNIQMLEAIGVERDLVGLPVLQPPEGWNITDPTNAGLLTYAENLLGNLRRDEQEGVFLPPGWELSLLSVGTSRRQFDVDKIINRYDKRIAITMLAQFIMLGMERVGSFALSTNQNDLFKLAVQAHINRIADVLNTDAVPRLFKLNPSLGRSGKLPRLIPSNVSAPDLTELAAYINSLTKAGIFPTENEELITAVVKLGRFFEQNEAKVGDLYRRAADKKFISGKKNIKDVKDVKGTNPTNPAQTKIPAADNKASTKE